MARGFRYLVEILDVASRKVLAFRLSNTLIADFCVAALEEVMRRFGRSELFNTEWVAQFTSDDWIGVLTEAGVEISMDGKGRWIDNVFIERLSRTVKCNNVYMHAYPDGCEAKQRLSVHFEFDNAQRLHQLLDYRTPDEVYLGACKPPTRAHAT